MSKQFSVAYLEDMSMLSFDMLEEICQNIGTAYTSKGQAWGEELQARRLLQGIQTY